LFIWGGHTSVQSALLSVAILPPDMAITPEFGRRLIPQIIDNLASTDPERIIYSITSLDNDALNFRHITAQQFANAVDKTAWWLVHHLGTTTSIQAIGYIGQREFILQSRPGIH